MTMNTALHTPVKEIAEAFVVPLLEENILSVRRDHIQIMGLVIPRQRLVYFHLALSQLRSEQPIKQSDKGYSVEQVTIVNGNDTEPGYKITDNSDNDKSILLTRRLAAELYEVIHYFVDIPTIDKTENNEVD